MGHTRKLITSVSKEFPEFIIFSGFDENFMHNVVCGGSGCIGGLSNIYPEVFSAWVKAIDAKDMNEVSKLQQKIDIICDLYDVGTPFIPIIKKAMMLKGIEMQDYCTKPFIQASDAETEKIKAIMSQVEKM